MTRRACTNSECRLSTTRQDLCWFVFFDAKTTRQSTTSKQASGFPSPAAALLLARFVPLYLCWVCCYCVLCMMSGDGGLRDATAVFRVPDPAASLHGHPRRLQGGDDGHRYRNGRGTLVPGKGVVLSRQRLSGAGVDPSHDHLPVVRGVVG